MDFLIVFCYILMSYGFAEMMVYFNGPFNIIEHFRQFTHWVSPSFGELFNCIYCTSTWIGLIFSLVNYLFVPVDFTPFNIILGETKMWWLIMLMDGMFTCGSIWLLYQLEEMMERTGKITDDN